MLLSIFKRFFTFFFIVILTTSSPAFAGSDDTSGFKVDSASKTTISGAFDSAYKGFQEVIDANSEKIKKASVNIFFTLALISMVWNLSQIMIKGTDFTSIFYELLKFTMMVGFFYWLIDGVDELIRVLLDEFARFSGSTFGFKMKDVADLINYGTEICGKILELKGAPTGGLFNFSIILSFFCFLIFAYLSSLIKISFFFKVILFPSLRSILLYKSEYIAHTSRGNTNIP